MKYRLLFSKRALKELKKMDKAVSALIFAWLKKNIDGAADPRAFGKALTGDKRGMWRYRIGDYRVLVNIEDENLTIIAIEIGHRRDIYK